MIRRGSGGTPRPGRGPTRPSHGSLVERLPVDGQSAVALWLTVVMVLSLLAVPAAGTALGGPAQSVGPGSDYATAQAEDPGNGGNGGGPSADDGNQGQESDGSQGQGSDGSQGQGSDGSQGQGSDGSQGQGSDGSQGQGSGPPEERGSDGNQGQGNDGSQGQGNGPPEERGSDGNGQPAQADRVNSAAQDEPGPPEGSNGPPPDDGPTVSVSRGQQDQPERGPGSDGPPGQADGTPPKSVVEVAVSDARAGDDVSVDVSPSPTEAGPVAFDEVSLTVRRGGDFTMRVTNSQEPLEGSPTFEPDDESVSLGRIRLDHSITNEEVEEVSFVFRVSKAKLRATATDPEQVVLYRFSDGEWTALPTDVVEETGSDYLLRVDSPGMSEFAVGAQRPSFETYWTEASPPTVNAGEPVRISGRVSNTGSADGVYEATLVVDGEAVETRRITVAAGGTRQVNFHRVFERPGTHTVTVGDVTVTEVAVEEPVARSEPASVGRTFSFALERVLDVGRALWTPWHDSTAGGRR